MNIQEITQAIDSQISRLQQARALLLQGNNSVARVAQTSVPKRRTLSAAGRRKIAAAQRARWAKLKKSKKS